MLFIRGPDEVRRIDDTDVRNLVELRFLEIVDGETYDAAVHGEMIVVEPGDDGASLEERTGCPILTNPFDGCRYGDDEFVPISEWIVEHTSCFEVLFLFSDDGAGTNIFLPKQPDIDRELLALCAQFAEPSLTR